MQIIGAAQIVILMAMLGYLHTDLITHTQIIITMTASRAASIVTSTIQSSHTPPHTVQMKPSATAITAAMTSTTAVQSSLKESDANTASPVASADTTSRKAELSSNEASLLCSLFASGAEVFCPILSSLSSSRLSI